MKNVAVMSSMQEIEIQIWRFDVMDKRHIFYCNGQIMENKEGLNL